MCRRDRVASEEGAAVVRVLVGRVARKLACALRRGLRSLQPACGWCDVAGARRRAGWSFEVHVCVEVTCPRALGDGAFSQGRLLTALAS